MAQPEKRDSSPTTRDSFELLNVWRGPTHVVATLLHPMNVDFIELSAGFKGSQCFLVARRLSDESLTFNQSTDTFVRDVEKVNVTVRFKEAFAAASNKTDVTEIKPRQMQSPGRTEAPRILLKRSPLSRLIHNPLSSPGQAIASRSPHRSRECETPQSFPPHQPPVPIRP